MRYLLAALITSLPVIMTAAVPALSRQSGEPAAVTAALKDARTACTDGITAQPGFMTRKDVNGDGIADAILDYSYLSCGEDPNHWCGTGGCALQIFASGDGTFKKAFADIVRDYRIRTVGGKAKLFVSQDGSACHRAGDLPCERTLTWDGQTFR